MHTHTPSRFSLRRPIVCPASPHTLFPTLTAFFNNDHFNHSPPRGMHRRAVIVCQRRYLLLPCSSAAALQLEDPARLRIECVLRWLVGVSTPWLLIASMMVVNLPLSFTLNCAWLGPCRGGISTIESSKQKALRGEPLDFPSSSFVLS